MNFSGADILEIVDKINGPDKKQNTKKDTKNPGVIFFAGAGINITKTTPAEEFQPLGATASTSYLPIVSGGINILINPNVGQAMLRLELSVSGLSYRSAYKDKVYPYVDIVYKYSAIWAALTPQFIYNVYNGQNFKFFGGLGMSFTYYNYMNASYADKDGKPVEATSADPYNFIKFGAPLMAKTGIRIHKNIEIYADYVMPLPVSNDEVFRLNFSSIQAGLNYYFK
jgi:hypothetical protein